MKSNLAFGFVILALVLAACGGQDSQGSTTSTFSTTTSTASTSPTTPLPSTTSSSTTSPINPDAVPPADCATAFDLVAYIELTSPTACIRVVYYQELAIVNRTGQPITFEFTLDLAPAPMELAADEVFAPPGIIGDFISYGRLRISGESVQIDLYAMKPETSVFATEPMRLKSWGPVSVGDTVAEAESKLGTPFVYPFEGFDPGDLGCQYGYIPGDPYSPGFMILDQVRVARIDANGNEHHTASGIRKGSTTEEVLAAYGDKIERSPHAYVNGEYLTYVPVDSADKDYRLVFSTDETGMVTSFQNGLEGPASWIEGCL